MESKKKNSEKQADYSAAMDLVIVEDLQGNRSQTPFFVTFGRNLIKKGKGKIIDLYINHGKTDLYLEIDSLGNAVVPIASGLSKLEEAMPIPLDQEVTETPERSREKLEIALRAGLNAEVVIDNPQGVQVDVPEATEDLESSNPHSEISETSKVLTEDSEALSRPDPQLKQAHPELIETENPTGPESINTDEETKSSQDSSKTTESDSDPMLPKSFSPELLKTLKLHEEINFIHFVLREDPSVSLVSKLYYWKNTCKIVITDIDGTITKSDMIGLFFGSLGIDWTKGGVVYFYDLLMKRGYKILYLSARAMPQINATRDYLAKIVQEGKQLPDGPLLLNPSGIWKSLVSELSKKSKDFKENMLLHLRKLFPGDYNPFYAGVGNREGDAVAYEKVGIPVPRIFILNKNNKEKGDFVSIKNFKDKLLKIDFYFPDLNTA